MSTESSTDGKPAFKQGDWIVHLHLRRMAVFMRQIGNGCRIQLLTGEHLVCLLDNVRPATDQEKKAGVKDVWAKIDGDSKFNPDSLDDLRKLIGAK